METQFDHKQFAILYVDDEELSLKNFARAFNDEFRIYTATNAKDGLKLIEEKPGEIGILMTDQKMPGEKGTWLLERARQLGATEADLLRSYPALRAEDLANAWAYVRSHQEQIAAQIREHEAA